MRNPVIVGPVDGMLPPMTNGQNTPYLFAAERRY